MTLHRLIAILFFGAAVGACSDSQQPSDSAPSTECTDDAECPRDQICAAQSCRAGCSPVHPCTNDELVCCQSQCVGPWAYLQQCGACAPGCEAGQVCARGGCVVPSPTGICQVGGSDTATAFVVDDGQGPDLAAGQTIAAALASACGTTVQIAEPALSQQDSTYIGQGPPPDTNPPQGKPLAGPGSLLVVAGGAVFQTVVEYMNTAEHTPIFVSVANEAFRFHERATATSIDCAPTEPPDLARDCFVTQVAQEPDSGSIVLIAYGIYEHGTAAAAWYLANVVLGDPALANKRWLVVRWDEDDLEGPGQGPSAASEFTVLASSSE